jgi:hypothetical protein
MQPFLMKTHSKRTGGMDDEIGKVPTTLQGRMEDANYLNQAIIVMKRYADQYQLPFKMVRVEPSFFEGRNAVIATFSLSPDSLTRMPPEAGLLDIPNVGKRNPPSKRSLNLNGQLEAEPPICKTVSNLQRKRVIELTFSDLQTLFPKRWLNSVVIDAMVHVLQEHFPLKRYLYVNSAEHDPSPKELLESVGCHDMILVVLWLKSHWTCVAINHRRKRIRYLNSQILNPEIAEIQTRPFRQIFPNYSVITHSPAQQDNSYDCGVYSVMSLHLMMYYDENEVEKITPKAATAYRQQMLYQLLLFFLK